MAERSDIKREGDDEDEEIDEIQYKHAKDAVLFAIDISKSMLEARTSSDAKNAEADSAVSAALKSALALMQQRIISSPNDMMGILLYGTEKTKFMSDEHSSGALEYPHCYLLMDVAIPAAEDIKKLRRLVEDEKEFKNLTTPSNEQAAMSNVLFCANQIFAQQAANFASRRLFIVTDNDNPHTSKDQREAAVVRARDLYELGVFIELFPIATPGGDFDRSKFFNEIVHSAAPSDPNAQAPLLQPTRVSQSGDGLSLLNSLLSSIDSRSVPKRAYFAKLPLELGSGFQISVSGYIIFKRQEIHKTCYVYVSEEKSMLANLSSSRFEDDDGKPLDKAKILKGYKFGGEHITFTPAEIASIRNFGEPIIRLLGFKKIGPDSLPMWSNLNRSTFIYPSEEGFIGSTRVFSALHQKLLSSNKMGLAWYIARKNATPVLVAILPGAEKLSDAGDQELPAGLWLVPLPFADDIRTIPSDGPKPPASDALIDKMRIVVQQLQLPGGRFVPSRYPNPALQWHFRVLQAMALEDTLPEQPQDKTVPRYKQIHKRAGPYVLEWGGQLEGDFRAWAEESGRGRIAAATELPKRGVVKEEDGEGPARKKVKTETGGLTAEDVRQAWKRDAVGKFTVTDLKTFAASKGIGVQGGKKAELVEAVEGWCETSNER